MGKVFESFIFLLTFTYLHFPRSGVLIISSEPVMLRAFGLMITALLAGHGAARESSYPPEQIVRLMERFWLNFLLALI